MYRLYYSLYWQASVYITQVRVRVRVRGVRVRGVRVRVRLG